MKALKFLWLFLVIILIIVIVVLIGFIGGFVYSQISKGNSQNKEPTVEQPITTVPSLPSKISTQQITSLLQKLGASSLHNSLFSKDTPKIEIETEDTVFYSEIVKGSIVTRKGSISNKDIKIITTSDEIVNALDAENTIDYIQLSVLEGKTSIEQVASAYTLYSKGYLSIYKSVTGQSIFDLF